MSPGTADRLLREARGRIRRVPVADAWHAARSGEAVIVDIRAADARERDGIVPGSLHIPRTVLEWRLDPDSAWRNPHVAGTTRRVLLLCDHGWSSSLAAAGLVELGYADATDVVGGIEAWQAAGLPLVPFAEPALAPGELPGMRGAQGLAVSAGERSA